MGSTPGFEPGPHWWEASALTTAPPLLPKLGRCGELPGMRIPTDRVPLALKALLVINLMVSL